MSSENFTFLRYPSGKSYLCLGLAESLVFQDFVDWEKLDAFVLQNQGKFIVTLISYDVKNSIERSSSSNRSEMDLPLLVYFVPDSVYCIENDSIDFIFGTPQEEWVKYLMEVPAIQPVSFHLQPQITKDAYLQAVRQAQKQIQLGNCYELNFCQNFHQFEVDEFDTWQAFLYLDKNTRAPFSSYFAWNGVHLMGASPERFIQKENGRLLSQPIKGTRPRMENFDEDQQMIIELQNDVKERAENVMIVDLVRNDLTRVAVPGTITVDELFGVYSFNAVHQMISTISCQLRTDVQHSEILKALFPMGSMTGAPKISAMDIIDVLESFKRGWYSGSLGLILPNGDFDMNVVIRTLIYDKNEGYICCPVGSAITILSEPHAEYEECLVKINRILSLFA